MYFEAHMVEEKSRVQGGGGGGEVCSSLQRFVRYVSFVTFRSLLFVRYVSFDTFRSLRVVTKVCN